MFRVVGVQVFTTLLAAAIAAALGGSHAALTSLLGGLSCALPNGLFAMHLAHLGRMQELHLRRGGSAPSQAVALLVGEFCKVVLTVALLGLLVRTYLDVVWVALIVSVCAVMLVQPLALAWRPRGPSVRQ